MSYINLYEFIRELIDRLMIILGLKKPEYKPPPRVEYKPPEEKRVVEYKEEKKVETKAPEEKKVEEIKREPLPDWFIVRCKNLGGEVYEVRCPPGYDVYDVYDTYYQCCVKRYVGTYPCDTCEKLGWEIVKRLDGECVCNPPPHEGGGGRFPERPRTLPE